MNFPTFDTLAFAKRLKSQDGFNRQQAENLAEAMADQQEQLLAGHLATKMDIADVRSEISDVRNEVADVRNELSDVRNEIADVRNELSEVRNEISDVRNEVADVRNEVSEVRNEVSEVRNEIADVRNEVANVKMNISTWGVILLASILMGFLAILVAMAAGFGWF